MPRRRPPRSHGRSVFVLILGVVLLASAGLGAYVLVVEGDPALSSDPITMVPPSATTASTTAPPSTPPATPTSTTPPTFAADGPGTYVYAPGQSPVLGQAGTLRRYNVAVETGLPVPPADFATMVDATLADGRSWIGSGSLRLQRVPQAAAGNFTIYLVTPGTAYRLCSSGGVDIRIGGKPYTSCRVGASVVINAARYLSGIPNYGAPLETYRQYAINHEVGHALGHGHELCPAKGKLAPVMQQQTLSLQGCLANAWPYLDGRRYSGPSGNY